MSSFLIGMLSVLGGFWGCLFLFCLAFMVCGPWLSRAASAAQAWLRKKDEKIQATVAALEDKQVSDTLDRLRRVEDIVRLCHEGVGHVEREVFKKDPSKSPSMTRLEVIEGRLDAVCESLDGLHGMKVNQALRAFEVRTEEKMVLLEERLTKKHGFVSEATYQAIKAAVPFQKNPDSPSNTPLAMKFSDTYAKAFAVWQGSRGNNPHNVQMMVENVLHECPVPLNSHDSLRGILDIFLEMLSSGIPVNDYTIRRYLDRVPPGYGPVVTRRIKLIRDKLDRKPLCKVPCPSCNGKGTMNIGGGMCLECLGKGKIETVEPAFCGALLNETTRCLRPVGHSGTCSSEGVCS